MSKIRGNQIKDESITGSQIENDTLTGNDIDESTLVMTLNDVLSDGASTTITITSGNIIPSADETYDLGSLSYTWSNIYSDNGQINNLTVNGTLIANTIDTEGDITLDANGGQIYMKDNGVTYLTFNVDGITDSIDAVGHLKLNATADIYLNAQQGDIYFQDNGTQRLRVENTSGDFAVGDHSPIYRLDVHKNTSSFVANIENDYVSAGADLLRMKLNISNPASSSAIIYVYDSSNTSIYAVQGNGAGGSTVSTSFTAGHDTVILKSENIIPGMIIESTGEIWFKPIDTTFETALPKCKLADSNGSKKVFGVISGFPSSEEDDAEYVHNGYKMKPAFIKYAQQAGVADNEWNISTMSIGEGVIWITNIGGNISNGDLIESSEIAGYGRLQPDDIMRSKTVAKCTEDIDWDSITDVINHNGIDYKKYLASCTFHCG